MRGVCTAALCACVTAGAVFARPAAAEEPDFFVVLNRAREVVSWRDVYPPPPSDGFSVPVSIRISEE